jgi:hypothetical protein
MQRRHSNTVWAALVVSTQTRGIVKILMEHVVVDTGCTRLVRA